MALRLFSLRHNGLSARSHAASTHLWLGIVATLLLFYYPMAQTFADPDHSHKSWLIVGMKLCLGFFLFSLAGLPITHVLLGSRTRPPQYSPFTFTLISVVVGQVALVLYVYAHSRLFPIPFSPLELTSVCLLCGTIWLCCVRKVPLPGRSSQPLPWLILVIGIFVIALWELPVFITPSSDPDQHAFFASFIISHGEVPFSMKEWGSLSFRYPAAFAALAAAWSLLSGLSIPEAVVMLPLLQTFIALLLISTLITDTLWVDKAQRYAAYGTLFAVAFLWHFFPLTYEEPFFHLSGTARLATPALLVLSAFLLSRNAFPLSDVSLSVRIAEGLLVGTTIAVLFLFNPAFSVVPLFALALTGIVAAFYTRGSKGTFLFLVASVIGLTATLLDPYGLHFFLGGEDSVRTTAISRENFITELPWPSLTTAPQAFYQNLGSLGFFSPALQLTIATGLFVALLWLRRRAVHSEHSLSTCLLALFMLFCVVSLFISPLTETFSQHPSLRLFGPYLGHALKTSVILWTFAAAILLSAALLTHAPRWFPICFAFILISAIFVRDFHTRNQRLRLLPRKTICAQENCVPKSDIRVLRTLRKIAASLPAHEPDATPRVLVASIPALVGGESWLFPVGGGRLLPLQQPLPVAFYYARADPDFTFENYNTYVCERFDIEWLRARRVRFVFIPSQRNSICVADIERLIRAHKRYRSGNSVLLDLEVVNSHIGS